MSTLCPGLKMLENTLCFVTSWGRRPSSWLLLALAVLLLAPSTGCKPDKEPDYPYGKLPKKPEAEQAAKDAGATQADAGESDAQVAEAPQADAKAGVVAAADAGSPADSGAKPEGVEAAPTGDLQGLFYGLVGQRLVGKGADGVHRYLFKPTGFFEHEVFTPEHVTIKQTGTYQLKDGQLVLTYKETRRTAGESGDSPMQSVTDGNATVPVEQAGKLHLRISGVEVAIDLDD